MTVTTEQFESRTTDSGSSQERIYLIRGTNDETAILSELTTNSPATITVEGRTDRKSVV